MHVVLRPKVFFRIMIANVLFLSTISPIFPQPSRFLLIHNPLDFTGGMAGIMTGKANYKLITTSEERVRIAILTTSERSRNKGLKPLIYQ